MPNESSAFDKLKSIIARLQSEYNKLQIVGRALTPAESARAEDLERQVAELTELLPALVGCIPPDPELAPPGVRDGRYGGAGPGISVDLRIDTEEFGVISADVFRPSTWDRRYVASVRTDPGSIADSTAGSWSVIWEDDAGNTATGKLTLEAVGEAEAARVHGTLRTDSPLAGLNANTALGFTAERMGGSMRSLGLEIETEQGVDPDPVYSFEGREVSIRSCFEDAGLEISNVGVSSPVATPPTGRWGQSQVLDLYAELNKAMRDNAQASLSRKAWELHLMMLSHGRGGLFGVMFDSTAVLPRQGAAVFASEISERTQGSHTQRKTIQTTVHELGHALNLAHRFEREVGRADSSSFMNYDWRYSGGNNSSAFWKSFRFEFDRDEVAFLRHGPRNAVIPGGAPFRTIRYWAEGTGGYSPYRREVSMPGYSLKLEPPTGGAVFRFGQQVFLRVVLKNTSTTPLPFRREWLDVKGGLLQIAIRRVVPGRDVESWQPIIHRCYDLASDSESEIGVDESRSDNLQLTYGATGFAFAEPGAYDVSATIAVPIVYQGERIYAVIESGALRIRVAAPHSMDDEIDAHDLFDDEVGVYLTVAGSDGLSKCRSKLEAVKLRREGRQLNASNDPVIANILRCDGINHGRPYHRRQAEREKAAALLESLDDAALRAFDEDTAKSTRALAAKHRRASK